MYDETLADRVRNVLTADREIIGDLEEKKMFGGLAFMLRGHMCCGITSDNLMVRLGGAQELEALAEPHVRPMDFTGRPMKGFVYVEPEGTRSEKDLRRWVGLSVRHVLSLPLKSSHSRTFRSSGGRRRDTHL
jgi:TfoX/Sxy family transcriptional regulator of competence genes